jgi:hypothetical protein
MVGQPSLLARLGGCAPSWSALGERKRGESGSLFELFAYQDLWFLCMACNRYGYVIHSDFTILNLCHIFYSLDCFFQSYFGGFLEGFSWGGSGGVSLRDLLWESHMRTLCLVSWGYCPSKPVERPLIWWFSVEPEERCSWWLVCDSQWFRTFRLNSFEGEDVHEVTQASPKSRSNPLGESGDRFVGSFILSHGLSSSRAVLEKMVWPVWWPDSWPVWSVPWTRCVFGVIFWEQVSFW